MSSEKTPVDDNESTPDNDDIEQNLDEAQDESSDVENIETADSDDSPDDSDENDVAKAQETVKEYWDQIMRLRAEMENHRKRAQRDVENAHKFSLKNFAEALLPVVDSMEMGIQAAQGENATLESIQEGNKLTLDMFVQVLEKNGLQQINPMGEKFDPESHQAISMVEDKSVESNTVVNVLQKGFSLNDRLVRPAMVMVSK